MVTPSRCRYIYIPRHCMNPPLAEAERLKLAKGSFRLALTPCLWHQGSTATSKHIVCKAPSERQVALFSCLFSGNPEAPHRDPICQVMGSLAPPSRLCGPPRFLFFFSPWGSLWGEYMGAVGDPECRTTCTQAPSQKTQTQKSIVALK